MAESLGTAVLTLTTDARQFNAGLDQVDQRTKGLKQSFSEVAKSVGAVGKDGKASLSTLSDAFRDPIQGAKALGLEVGSGMVGNFGLATVAITATVGAVVAVGAALVGLTLHAAHAGAALDDASEITGISVERLSGYKFAIESAGGTLDQFTNTLFKMQQRMEENPKDFEEGLKRIGLTAKELERLTLDEKFLKINQAFLQIGPGADQAAAAIAMFGKQGRDFIPLLNEDIQGLVNRSRELGLVWSTEDATAAEDLERKSAELHAVWSNIWIGIGNFFIPKLHELLVEFGNLATFVQDARENFRLLWAEVRNVPTDIRAPKLLIGEGPTSPALSVDEATKVGKAIEDEIKKQQAARAAAAKKEATDRAKAVADNLKIETQIRADAYRTWAQMQDFNALREMRDLEQQYQDEQAGLQNNLKIQTDQRADAYRIWAKQQDQQGLQLMQQAERQYQEAIARERHFARTMTESLTNIPGLVVQAFTSGGGTRNAIRGIGASLGRDLFSGIFGAAGSKGEDGIFKQGVGLLKNFDIKGVFGKLFTTAVPIVGSLLGPLLSGLSKLFGKSEESAKVSPLRDEFFRMQGGLEKLNPRVLELTGSLKLVDAVFRAKTVDQYNTAIANLTAVLEGARQKVLQANDAFLSVRDRLSSITTLTPELQAALETALNAKTPEDYLAALQGINGVIDEQAAKFQKIQSTLDKYGLSWTEAGQEFKQAKLNEVANGLITDFDLLRQAGVDVNHQMKAMGPSLNQFVKDAQAAGVEIPNAMKTVLQTAIDAGELFDADGKKIENLGELGLTFGDTMQTVMSDIKTAIGSLELVLRGLADFFGITLPAAAQKGADGVQGALDGIEAPDLTVRVGYDTSGFPKGGGYDVPAAETSARGSFVRPWGLQYLAAGGLAASLAAFSFVPKGSDVIPAMLTPGEGVVNTLGMHRLGVEGLQAINHGAPVETLSRAAGSASTVAPITREDLAAAVREGLAGAPPSLTIAPGAIQFTGPTLAEDEYLERKANVLIRGIGRYYLEDFQRLKART